MPPPGATIKDVAHLAGVAVSTVSLTLNTPDRVLPATRQRVHAAIRTLGFVRNSAARDLRKGDTQTIGILLRDVRNPFYASLARGIEERSAEGEYLGQLGYSAESTVQERRYLDLFIESRVSGLIVAPVMADLRIFRELVDRGVPVVLLDHGVEDGSLASVLSDSIEGGKLAARHLLAEGRRRLMFVGDRRRRQVDDRLLGARQVVSDHGKEAEIRTLDIVDLSIEGGRAAAAQLLALLPRDRPDGILAANDLVAAGLLQVLLQDGSIRVPEDLAIIGYDDIPYAGGVLLGLSTVRQPSHEIGYRAAELLLSELRHPEGVSRPCIRLTPELVVRGSSRI